MSKVAVTGALSYTGRYLTRRLLDRGTSVVSLSSRNKPFANNILSEQDISRVTTHPLSFDDPARLTASLEGCETLFCTYWIRFAIGGDSHDAAVKRCETLFEAARAAGVHRIVFSSHTQATVDSPFEYIAGKAQACEALRRSGIPSYGIVKPCGIFGDTPKESLLFNNAAWVMRRTPLFLLPNQGTERFQPIHVRDMAELMDGIGVDKSTTNYEKDACGPDAPTALELFSALQRAVKAPAIVAAPGFLTTKMVSLATAPINWYTGDILLDTDDLDLLGGGLTVADNPEDPDIAKRRSVFKWMEEVGDELGTEYHSSMTRYYTKKTPM